MSHMSDALKMRRDAAEEKIGATFCSRRIIAQVGKKCSQKLYRTCCGFLR